MMAVPIRRSLASLITALALAGATLVVFSSSLRGGFLFDDFPNLVDSTSWRLGEGLGWRNLFSSDISGPLGRPLAIASFALNQAATGMVPFWFKLTNLALHLLNGLLVWRLCIALFVQLPAGPRPGHWAASLVAAAWLVHPLQVSSVAYVIQRMELGAATGVLLSLLAYVHARRRQILGEPWLPWLVASAGAMALGLGFKESALLVPGFTLLVEACVFRFAGKGGTVSRPWVATYAALFVAALIIYFGWALPAFLASTAYELRDFTATERLLTQLPVLCMYIGQILLPLPESLTFYYDNFPVSRSLASPPGTLVALFALSGLGLLAVAVARRWPLTALGIGWFFVGHLLTSNVVPLELAFEHRNYLPLLGILVALVQPLISLGSALRLHDDARIALACVPVLGLAALCAVQAATWGDPLRLAWTLENRNPESPRAVYGLGAELYAAAGDDAGSPAWSMALGQFQRALALPGGSTLAAQGILVMHGRAGRPMPEDAWPAFRADLLRRPLNTESATSLYWVAQCRIDGQCRWDDGELLATFMALLERNPRSDVAHTMYANFAWNVLQDPDLALRLQREAVAISQASRNRLALAKFLLASGDPEHVAEGTALMAELQDEGHEPAGGHGALNLPEAPPSQRP